MKYRHEWKFEITPADRLALRQRLSAVLQTDPHAIDGKYHSRTLYFDTPDDRALREKIDGVNLREKFRIRYYNGDLSYISLERKSKVNGLCGKVSVLLSPGEAAAVAAGDTAWMRTDDRPLCRELYAKMQTSGLAPKTVVDYTREAFVYAPGHVRVTLDYDIRTGLGATDFLDPRMVTIPAGDPVTVLEVKWDDFLPQTVRDCVSLPGRRVGAFSKYALCRIYD